MAERRLNNPQMREKVLADSPIRRAAEPEDIAGLLLFLAPDLASIITGAICPIDSARTRSLIKKGNNKWKRYATSP